MLLFKRRRRMDSRFTPSIARRDQFDSQRTDEPCVLEDVLYQLVVVLFGHCALVGIVTRKSESYPNPNGLLVK